MKSTRIRKERGITLIALIITIVVLMVLAAVAISSIKNDGIIAHANNATHKYQEAQNNEQIFLNQYENFLNNGGNIGDDTGDGGNQEPVILATPTISVSGDTLTITAVTSATSYDVYVNNTLKTNTTSTTVDLTEFNLEPGTYSVTVKAKAEGYTDSQLSASVTYVIEIEGFTVSYSGMYYSYLPTYVSITLTFTDDSTAYYKLHAWEGTFPEDWEEVTGYSPDSGWVDENQPYVWTNVKSVSIEAILEQGGTGTPKLFVNGSDVGATYSATLTENITFYNEGGNFGGQ